jgi:hypothetical protein
VLGVRGDRARKRDGTVRAQEKNMLRSLPCHATHMCCAFLTGPCAQGYNSMRLLPCHAARARMTEGASQLCQPHVLRFSDEDVRARMRVLPCHVERTKMTTAAAAKKEQAPARQHLLRVSVQCKTEEVQNAAAQEHRGIK